MVQRAVWNQRSSRHEMDVWFIFLRCSRKRKLLHAAVGWMTEEWNGVIASVALFARSENTLASLRHRALIAQHSFCSMKIRCQANAHWARYILSRENVSLARLNVASRQKNRACFLIYRCFFCFFLCARMSSYRHSSTIPMHAQMSDECHEPFEIPLQITFSYYYHGPSSEVWHETHLPFFRSVIGFSFFSNPFQIRFSEKIIF